MATQTTEQPAVDVEDLGRNYGERPALAGVTLTLARGQTLAVFGTNGAGNVHAAAGASRRCCARTPAR